MAVTAAARKSRLRNALEGSALTAILQGFPIFAAASLMVRLLGDDHGSPPVLTIAMASVFYSIFVVSVGSVFPRVKSAAWWRAMMRNRASENP